MSEQKTLPPPPPRAVGPSVPLIHQLPAHGTSVDRIGQHTKGLVDDVKEWVDLRIQLLQTEIHDQVRGKVNELLFRLIPKILPFVMAGFGAIFLLIALALGVGWWLGHAFWGFLTVGVVFIAVFLVSNWWFKRQQPLNPDSPHHPENQQNQKNQQNPTSANG